MSTDYGFGCITCGREDNYGYSRLVERYVIDNCRSPELLAKLLKVDAEPLGLVAEVLELVGHTWDLREAMLFVRKHKGLGHEVVVVDEYGETFAVACAKMIECPHCKTRHACGLANGHAGDCDRTSAKRG